MGILARFTDIIQANVNAVLDKMEDPAKMIDQYLRELTDSLAEVKGNRRRDGGGSPHQTAGGREQGGGGKVRRPCQKRLCRLATTAMPRSLSPKSSRRKAQG